MSNCTPSGSSTPKSIDDIDFERFCQELGLVDDVKKRAQILFEALKNVEEYKGFTNTLAQLPGQAQIRFRQAQVCKGLAAGKSEKSGEIDSPKSELLTCMVFTATIDTRNMNTIDRSLNKQLGIMMAVDHETHIADILIQYLENVLNILLEN